MPVHKPASIIANYSNRIEALEGILNAKGIPHHMFHPLRRQVATQVTGTTPLEDYTTVCIQVCDNYLHSQIEQAVAHEQKRQEIMGSSELDAHFGAKAEPTTLTIDEWLRLPEQDRPEVRYNFNAVETIYRDPTYNDTNHYVIRMAHGGAGSKLGDTPLAIVDHLKHVMIWWTGLYNKHQVKTRGGPDISDLRHTIAGVPSMKGYTARQCRVFQESALNYMNDHYPIGAPAVPATTDSPPPVISNDQWKEWAAPWKAKGYTSQSIEAVLVDYAEDWTPPVKKLTDWPFDLTAAEKAMAEFEARPKPALKDPHRLTPPDIRKKYTIQMKRFDKKSGKDVFTDYLQVPGRVLLLRIDHPDWSIETELLQIDANGATMKAMIRNEAGSAIATGHASATVAGSDKFSGRVIEKAETSAVGRALALAGYGTDEADSDFEE